MNARREVRLTGAFVGLALAALAVGSALGPVQALQHAGLDLYPGLPPLVRSYHHGLTLHGVLNLLVWPLFFAAGFLPWVARRALGTPVASLALPGAALGLMLAGLLVAAAPLVTDRASVFFTFYPPLRAHWAFYVGLTAIVAGSWLVTLDVARAVRAWRRRHPGAATPLGAFLSLVALTTWSIASVGIAAELVGLLIPWSAGWRPTVDVRLARTLFWFSGHTVVSFPLLAAAVSWCALAPGQAGGRLASDPAVRLAFLVVLTLSVPLGFDHEHGGARSGLGETIHTLLSLAIRVPSLVLLLVVGVSLARGVRGSGARSWGAAARALFWQEPALAAQGLALVLLGAGGAVGAVSLVPATGEALHATMWTTGHAHLTVGGVATLTFMGITYWLVPVLAGRGLWAPRVARVQVWLWFGGLALLSAAQHALGLSGAPRRTMLGTAAAAGGDWRPYLATEGVAGVALSVSALLYFANLGLTLMASSRPAPAVPLLAEARPARGWSAALPARLWPWLVVTGVLIGLAYGPTLWPVVAERASTTRGSPPR